MKLQYLYFTVASLALSSLNALPPEGDEKEKTSTFVKAASSVSEQAANPEEKNSLNLIRNIPIEVTLTHILPGVNAPSIYSLRLTHSYFADLSNDPIFLQHHGRQLFGISLEGIPEDVLLKHSVNPDQTDIFESNSNFQRFNAGWIRYYLTVFSQHAYDSLLKAVLESEAEWLGLSTDIYPIKDRIAYVKETIELNYKVEFLSEGILWVPSLREAHNLHKKVFGSKVKEETPGALVQTNLQETMRILPALMQPNNYFATLLGRG